MTAIKMMGAAGLLGALAVPAFFLNAPAWVMALEAFVIAATVTALVLLRRPPRLQEA